MANPPDEGPERRRLFAFCCLILLLISVIASARARPPAARSASAPASEFSAERAKTALASVLGNGAPHPVGSPENDAVRARIVARLGELGYAPELETATACGRLGGCARVTNILARRPGKSELPALLLAAHYDSVPAGAGASDDGIGVATLLEVARAIAHDEPRERPIAFLFDDGEEAGLLGAEAYAEKHAISREIGLVLNIEARGTRGPSLMFETSGGSAPLVDLFAQSATRPLTSSLFYAVYRSLPNDTDLTVFRREGVPGYNFAIIGGVAHYHTSLDDLAHLSLDSLQHHGQSVLALTRRLGASASLPDKTGGEAVFFDVLGFSIVRWPIGFTRAIAISGVLLWAIALGIAFRKRALAVSGYLRALSVWPLAPVLATLMAYIAFLGLRSFAGLSVWAPPAYPLPALVISPAAAFAASAGSLALRARSSAWDEWAACFTWWALFLCVLAFAFPEASYLFLVPLAGAAIAGAIGLFVAPPARALWAALGFPIVLAGALWFPLLGISYDALAFAIPAVFGAASALALGPFFCSLGAIEIGGRKLVLGLSLVVFLVAILAAGVVPKYSTESPSRTSVAYDWNADTARARYLVDSPASQVPPSLLRAASFSKNPVDPAPWIGSWSGGALEAPAPAIALAAPAWDVLQVETTPALRVRAKLRSLRGARIAGVFIPIQAGLRSIHFDHRLARVRDIGRNHSVTFLGALEDGIEVEIELTQPTSILIWDESPGLPPGAEAILSARPGSAVPSQLGDISLAGRRIEIRP